MDPDETFEHFKLPGAGLGQRVVKGGVWVVALKAALKIIGLTRLVIVARLLSPFDFGLMGIALLLKGVTESFSQTGFEQALIQKKEDIRSHLDSAWTLLILRGFCLFALLYMIAPTAAAFFSAPKAMPIIRVIGFSIFLHAFTNVGIVYFKKELEFNKQFIYQLGVSLIDTLVTIIFAFLLRSVWALVFGWIAGEVAGIIISYAFHPYRPKFNFNLSRAGELFRFGKWVLAANVAIFFATQGDDFFLGKVLGITALGFYQMAFRIGNLPSSEITGMIGKVAFPAYSKLQTAPRRLREAYLKVVTLSTLVSIPLAGGIVVLAPQFVRIFMGEKWLPIILPLQILAVSGLLRSLAGTGGSLFNAIGKPQIGFRLNVVRLIIIAATIYPLTLHWGIAGTSFSVLLGIAGGCVIWLRHSIKETTTRISDYVRALLPPLGSTLLLGLTITALAQLPPGYLPAPLLFFLSLALGGVVYLGSLTVMGKLLNYNGLSVLKMLLANLRKPTL